MTAQTDAMRKNLSDARRKEWADPVIRQRRLSAMRRALVDGGKKGRALKDRPVVIRGDTVPVAAIPRDPVETLIFGGAA